MNYINHYNLGMKVIKHRDKAMTVSIPGRLATYIDFLKGREQEIAYVPPGYEHRPDLLSYLFYGSVTKDWLLMMVNNIVDPFQGFNVGDRILIPKI